MTFPDRVTHRRSFLHDHTEKYSIASVNLTAVYQFQKSKKAGREKEKRGDKKEMVFVPSFVPVAKLERSKSELVGYSHRASPRAELDQTEKGRWERQRQK